MILIILNSIWFYRTINERDRPGLKPLLTLDENHTFAINTITKHKTRLKFIPLIKQEKEKF
jgi:hypothetical protein